MSMRTIYLQPFIEDETLKKSTNQHNNILNAIAQIKVKIRNSFKTNSNILYIEQRRVLLMEGLVSVNDAPIT